MEEKEKQLSPRPCAFCPGMNWSQPQITIKGQRASGVYMFLFSTMEKLALVLVSQTRSLVSANKKKKWERSNQYWNRDNRELTAYQVDR